MPIINGGRVDVSLYLREDLTKHKNTTKKQNYQNNIGNAQDTTINNMPVPRSSKYSCLISSFPSTFYEILIDVNFT